MPTYDYQCEKCDHKFSAVLSLTEHEEGGVECPQCKEKEVKQLMTLFTAKTSRKS